MLSKAFYFLGIMALAAGLIFGYFAMSRWLSYESKIIKAQNAMGTVAEGYAAVAGELTPGEETGVDSPSLSGLVEGLQKRGAALLGGIQQVGPMLGSFGESLLTMRELFDEAMETHESFSLHAHISVPSLILSGWLCFLGLLTSPARRS